MNNAALTEEKKRRKHHSIMDTQGTLVYGTVHEANHRRGFNVFQYSTLKSVCVDSGYGETMVEFVGNGFNKTIEISERISPE
ncbi:transposase [Holospora curviuscula]|uniref:transposase n=1 Tax=Holospora curviuscula TaxID=1082868 RepID=UPI00101AE2AC|nr:transposase [Holospora curviuscula]